MIARTAALALALGATGCATIVQGPDQRVFFETEPPGATVRTATQGCTTPCSLRLKRNRNVDAQIRRPGYEPETVYVRYELDPWILGNIVFLPLAPLGGAVDIVTGAGFQLYPPFVVIPLRPTESAPRPEGVPGREEPAPDAPKPGAAPPPAPDMDLDSESDADGDWKPIPGEHI